MSIVGWLLLVTATCVSVYIYIVVVVVVVVVIILNVKHVQKARHACTQRDCLNIFIILQKTKTKLKNSQFCKRMQSFGKYF